MTKKRTKSVIPRQFCIHNTILDHLTPNMKTLNDYNNKANVVLSILMVKKTQ